MHGPRHDAGGILDGYVENGSLTVSRSLDATTREFVVTITGHTRAHGTERLAVDVSLDEGSCATHGPQGTPDRPVATQTIDLRDPATNASVPFETSLRSPSALGPELMVYARPHADNAVGPIFGLCRNVPS